MTIIEESEFLSYFDTLSNRGKWGPEDKLGTLNYVTPEKRVSASRLVKTGQAVSCAWDIDTAPHPNEYHGPPRRFMLRTGEGLTDKVISGSTRPRQQFTMDYLGMAYHGSRITHVDALSHCSWDGKMFNGYPATLVTADQGAQKLDVVGASTGIVTRGILLDVPKHRGIKWTELGDYITVDEVRSILASEKLDVEPGDILLLRTGNGRKMMEEGLDHVGSSPGSAGFHVSCLPLFFEKGVSLIGADTPNDRNTSDYASVSSPIHAVCLTAIGLWLIDNCNLEKLAQTCDELNTSEFELIISALPFVGATGCPVNPLAIF